MANNDWYKPHEKDVVMALKKGKSASKEDAVPCSMVRMKEGAFFICAHVSPPKAGAMVKEARNAGGKSVAAGRLFLGEEGVTFEVDDGDLSIKQKFSTAAAALGSPMSVVVRAAPGSPAEAAALAAAASAAPPGAPPTASSGPKAAPAAAPSPGARPQAAAPPAAPRAMPPPAAPRAAPPAAPAAVPPAAPPPATNMATVRAALAKLIPTVQQAAKEHPEHKNALLAPLSRCQQHIKDNQPVEANAILVEVANQVKALANGAPTPATQPKPTQPGADAKAAPPPAPPAPPAASDDTAAVRAALAKLVPTIQQAVKAHPEQKNELLQPLARIQQHIKDNQPVEAKALLVDVAKRVKALAGAPVGAPAAPVAGGGAAAPEIPKAAADQPAPEKPPEAPAAPDEFKELYEGLLETIPGDLRRYREADPAAAAQIQKVIDGATARAAKGDFQKAFSFLNRAAEVIAKATGAGRAKQAADVIPEGKVAAMKAVLSQAQSRWGAAVTAARTRMKPVQAALQAEFPSAAAGVNNILDWYEQQLVDELRAGQAKADEEGLAAGLRDARARVQSLRVEVASDKLFATLQECGVPVTAAFAAAFDEVESLLQH